MTRRYGIHAGAVAVAIVMGWILAGSSQAAILQYEATEISGSQEVPPNDSPATGNGTFEIDTDANTISYNITFEEDQLLGPETASHIHCCAPPGENAGVIITLPLGNPKVGVETYDQANETDILAGLSYVNIHSEAYSGGEIRGQITQAPTPDAEGTWGKIKDLYR